MTRPPLRVVMLGTHSLNRGPAAAPFPRGALSRDTGGVREHGEGCSGLASQKARVWLLAVLLAPPTGGSEVY